MFKKILILITAITLSACAGSDNTPDPTDEQIYTAAHELMVKGNYEDAAIKFEELDKMYPSSKWVADALISASYSYYMNGNYADAIMDIDRFMRFHPGHKNADYMLYLRGMSFMAQASDVRREASMTSEAIAAFNTLRERFPKSEYAKNAENKINILRNYLAGKIMYVARQDMREENWTSAITRLNGLTIAFQDSVMVPEALYRLAVCYTALNVPSQVATYQNLLKTNYPDTDWYQQAMKLNK
jgi:outer membrane protein assembly factor BamD